MKDLTEGWISAHIVEMAVPMGIGMLVLLRREMNTRLAFQGATTERFDE